MSRFLSTNVAPKSSKASILSCLDTKSALAIRYSTMCIWPVTAAASKGVMPGNITKVFYLGQIRHIEIKVFWKSYLWRKKTRPSICIQVKVSRLNYCSGHLKVNLIKQSSAHYSNIFSKIHLGEKVTFTSPKSDFLPKNVGKFVKSHRLNTIQLLTTLISREKWWKLFWKKLLTSFWTKAGLLT